LTDQTATSWIHFLGLEIQLIHHSDFLKLQIHFVFFSGMPEFSEILLNFKKAVNT
jgi:hypothetical protein